MKKIIAFLGSPRRNGASAAVLEQVIAGARAEGAEVISYYMNDETVTEDVMPRAFEAGRKLVST